MLPQLLSKAPENITAICQQPQRRLLSSFPHASRQMGGVFKVLVLSQLQANFGGVSNSQKSGQKLETENTENEKVEASESDETVDMFKVADYRQRVWYGYCEETSQIIDLVRKHITELIKATRRARTKRVLKKWSHLCIPTITAF